MRPWAKAALAGTLALGLLVSVAGMGVIPRAATTQRAAELKGAALELEETLRRAARATYHARYDAQLPGLDGIQVVIETWRRDGDVRQDMVAAAPGGEVRTTTIESAGRRQVCSRRADEAWECRSEATSRSDPLLGSIRQQLAHAQVTARDARIGAHQVRCFTLAGASERELCATSEGVPVLVRADGSRLSLISVDDDVSDGVFRDPDAA